MSDIKHLKLSTKGMQVPIQGLLGSLQTSHCELGVDTEEKYESPWAARILYENPQPNRPHDSFLLQVSDPLLKSELQQTGMTFPVHTL